MQPLNYCRQMAQTYRSAGAVHPDAREKFEHFLGLTAEAAKFILPVNGRVIIDPELRALDPADELRLPFPVIVLEYPVEGAYQTTGNDISKHIIVAWEMPEGVDVWCAAYDRSRQAWGIGEAALLPRHGNLRGLVGGAREVVFHPFYEEGRSQGADADHWSPVTLMTFLNALACSNVGIERSEPSKTRRAMGKKGALPFDTYHVLTVDVAGGGRVGGVATGDHRSPREHLRRGHIRRLADGRRIWVNAAVINAGIGGKVSKDYRVHIGH